MNHKTRNLLDDPEYRRGIEEYVRDLASKNPYCPNCVRVADEMRKRLKAEDTKSEGR